MTTAETMKRSDKSNALKVFMMPEGQHYVESSEGKICYRVSRDNGNYSCSCGDFTSSIAKDPSFRCKHIMAVINGNGNIRRVDLFQAPKLDDRFIMRIKGKEFVLYTGLLDLAHQRGIRKVIVEPVQYPTKDNKMEAICRATIESQDGQTFIEIADANPLNVNRMVAEHILRVAATRAKARALRDMTNIGMTCLEELGDFDDDDDAGRTKARSKREVRTETATTQTPQKQEQSTGAKPNDRTEKKEGVKRPEAGPVSAGAEPPQQQKKAEEVSDSKNQKDQAKPSEAQIKAIEKLAERRGINGEQLVKIFTDKFRKPYVQINADEAKDFIKHLQQAA
jgi:predicted nucleic acid-binding Zn finger protein